MKKTIVIFMSFIIPLSNLGNSYAYPVLSYSEKNKVMHLSPQIKNPSSATTSSPIYLHLFNGDIKPEQKWFDDLVSRVTGISPDVTVKVLNNSAPWRLEQYRVIVGPITPESIINSSKSLKYQGFDNFPIYFNDVSLSLLSVNNNLEQNAAMLTTSDDDNNKESFEHSATLTTLAQTAVDLENGQTLEDKVLNYAKQTVESYSASYAEDWLSKYGTAQVQVQLDSDFNLSSGELDMLYPFLTKQEEDKSSTFFVQYGVVLNDENTFDGRDFAHVGVGYRSQIEGAFWGLNSFYDYDLTRYHQRASVGAEYTQDLVKLSANYYFPLSDWKDSPNKFDTFGDSELIERPASGFDINAKSYIPSYPNFYLTAEYQQFFGDYIETRRGDEPVNDLYTVSTALNYQPIPMITFNAGYEYEKDGDSGVTVGSNLVYRFGVPISKQIDPSQVQQSNTIQAQLFDLVERDHNIRLEFEEKTIETTVEFKALSLDVKEASRHVMKDWVSITGDPASVLGITYSGTAAGFITADGIFVAPRYTEVTTRSTVTPNVYDLSFKATLVDGREIVSPNPVIVKVAQDTDGLLADYSATAVTPVSDSNPVSYVGVGNDRGYRITAKVKNQFDRPLANQEVVFSALSSGGQFADGSTQTVTSDASGNVQAILKSTKAGDVIFTVSAGDAVTEKQVRFIGDLESPSATLSSLTTSKATVLSNNTDEAELKLVLKDEFGNPLTDNTVVFNSSVTTDVTVTATTNNGDGSYTAKIKGTPDTTSARITVSVNGDDLSTSPLNVSFSNPITSIRLSTTGSNIVIDGRSTSITLTAMATKLNEDTENITASSDFTDENSLVEVDSAGRLRALNVGTAAVTVTQGEVISNVVNITVEAFPVISRISFTNNFRRSGGRGGCAVEANAVNTTYHTDSGDMTPEDFNSLTGYDVPPSFRAYNSPLCTISALSYSTVNIETPAQDASFNPSFDTSSVSDCSLPPTSGEIVSCSTVGTKRTGFSIP